MNAVGLGMVIRADDLASGVLRRIGVDFKQVENRVGKSKLNAQLIQIGVAAGAAAVGFAGLAIINTATNAAKGFQAAIAEVSTLVDSSVTSNRTLVGVVDELVSQFGGSSQEQARALYQTISAGITDAADAQRFLVVANKAAIAGNADVFTSVDGLTSILNSFRLEVTQVGSVSDKVFTAIKEGKTTFNEISQSIGRVAATASNAGISLDELLAALATATKGGLQTSEVISGLKIAISNIQRPAADAQKEAEKLGIQFDSAGLRAKGLKGFLDDIIQSANFNADSFKNLFGSVEALNAITLVAQGGAEEFNRILKEMGTSADATNVAFEKQAATLTQVEKRFDGISARAFEMIGGVFIPLKIAVLEAIIPIVQGFTKLSPVVRKAIVTMFGVASAALAIGGSFIAIQTAIALVGPAVVAAAGAALTALAPFLPIIAGIVAGAGLISLAWSRNLGGMQDKAAAVFDKIKLIGQVLFQQLFSGKVQKDLTDRLGAAGNEGAFGFVVGILRIVDTVKRVFTTVVRAAEAFIEPLIDPIMQLAGTMQEVLFEAFSVVGEVLTALGSAFGETGKDMSTAAQIGELVAFAMKVMIVQIRAVIPALKIVGGILAVVGRVASIVARTIQFLASTIGTAGKLILGLFGGSLSGVLSDARTELVGFQKDVVNTAKGTGQALVNLPGVVGSAAVASGQSAIGTFTGPQIASAPAQESAAVAGNAAGRAAGQQVAAAGAGGGETIIVQESKPVNIVMDTRKVASAVIKSEMKIDRRAAFAQQGA